MCYNAKHIKFLNLIMTLKTNTIHIFSVWLRAGSNPTDINPLRSHTGNIIMPMETFKNGREDVRVLSLIQSSTLSVYLSV